MSEVNFDDDLDALLHVNAYSLVNSCVRRDSVVFRPGSARQGKIGRLADQD